MEILLRVVDKSSNPLASKAGDVIAVKPDGWPWTPEELTRNEWRIIRAPILQTLADTLLLVDQDPITNNLLRRRKWTIITASLSSSSQFIGTRLSGIITLTQSDVLSAAIPKP